MTDTVDIRRLPLEERLWSRVDGGDVDACWLWTGPRDKAGYGHIGKDGKTERVHRVTYELLIAPIPEGLTIDHLCFTPACVNPWHMEPVTRAENSRRVRANQHKHKTHCPDGHPYDEQNTYLYAGRRYCRECRRSRNPKVNARRRIRDRAKRKDVA